MIAIACFNYFISMNIYGCIISMLTIAVEAGDWNRDGVTDLYFGIFRGADINDKRNEVKVAGTPFRRHNAWQANCNNGTLFRCNTKKFWPSTPPAVFLHPGFRPEIS
jgi:hypothetical protein